jgi:succinate--hydroxymethylglutarate CoA-transferase
MLKEIEHRTLGPVKFLNTPLRYRNAEASVGGPPPAFIGEHTEDILSGLLELDDEEIKRLRAKGVVS